MSLHFGGKVTTCDNPPQSKPGVSKVTPGVGTIQGMNKCISYLVHVWGQWSKKLGNP